MDGPATKAKSAARVAAGRRNRQRRTGLTPEGRERLRESARRHRPWERSTGPTTAEGKAAAAANLPRPAGLPSAGSEIKSLFAALADLGLPITTPGAERGRTDSVRGYADR